MQKIYLLVPAVILAGCLAGLLSYQDENAEAATAAPTIKSKPSRPVVAKVEKKAKNGMMTGKIGSLVLTEEVSDTVIIPTESITPENK